MRRESKTNVAPGSVGHITHCLKGIDFPKSKTEVVNFCKEHGGADLDIEKLQNIPRKKYGTMSDLMRGISNK